MATMKDLIESGGKSSLEYSNSQIRKDLSGLDAFIAKYKQSSGSFEDMKRLLYAVINHASYISDDMRGASSDNSSDMKKIAKDLRRVADKVTGMRSVK